MQLIVECVLLSLNNTGKTHFEPRPAVSNFLKRKERQYNLPDQKTYENHSFIKMFFEK